MIATFFALFVPLACCQALLTVKLADWLSPGTPKRAAAVSASVEGGARLA